MKKVILATLCVASLQFNSNAQVHDHTLGLRAGSAFPPRFWSVHYQKGLGDHSRLDFGINLHGGFSNTTSHIRGSLSAYYQHVWNIKGGFNWFLGAGVKYGFAGYSSTSLNQFYDRLSFGPQIGLEYDFNRHNVPLVFGMDFRPSIGVPTSNFQDFTSSGDFGISLRYTF